MTIDLKNDSGGLLSVLSIILNNVSRKYQSIELAILGKKDKSK